MSQEENLSIEERKQHALRIRLESALREYKAPKNKEEFEEIAFEFINGANNYPKELVLEVLKETYPLIDQEEKIENSGKEIVSLPESLNQLKNIIKKYIDTSDANISLISIWILATYFHSQFNTFPIAQLHAEKASGKTRTLKIASTLCKNGDGNLTASLTETHLFRRGNKPAFIDELESINNKEQGNLKELLNSTYKKGSTVSRYREVKGEYKEEIFSPFYPIMLANINGLGDVLADRAIKITLRKSNKAQTRLMEDFDTNPEILKLIGQLKLINSVIPQKLSYHWNNFIQNGKCEDDTLKPLFMKIKESNIYGRPLEIFFPLFIVSHLAEDLDNILKIAKAYVESKTETEAVNNFDERLKTFIYAQQVDLVGFVELKSLVDKFRLCIETPEAWINSKWVAKSLDRLDLIAQRRLVNGKTQIRIKYNLEDISTKSTNPLTPTISTKSTKDNIINNKDTSKPKSQYEIASYQA